MTRNDMTPAREVSCWLLCAMAVALPTWSFDKHWAYLTSHLFFVLGHLRLVLARYQIPTALVTWPFKRFGYKRTNNFHGERKAKLQKLANEELCNGIVINLEILRYNNKCMFCFPANTH